MRQSQCPLETLVPTRHRGQTIGWRLAGSLLVTLATASLTVRAVPSLGLAQDGRSRRVMFSGSEWEVKSSRYPVGPGPNVFREQNVDVDPGGRLHLAIARHGGTWTSAEIASRQRFGYGTYRFTVVAVPDDPQVILGLFTWDEAPSDPFRREIDIEIGRWGDPNHPNTQCVVQPPHATGNIVRFNMPDGRAVHEFRWSREGVSCLSRLTGPAKDAGTHGSVQRYVLPATPPPAGTANVRINLWLAEGRPPSREGVLKAIVESFEFVPE